MLELETMYYLVTSSLRDDFSSWDFDAGSVSGNLEGDRLRP
jgi:hypothetical protein